MDLPGLTEYIVQVGLASDDSWQELALRRLAQVHIPPYLLGRQGWLLEADAKITWTNWYVDSLVNRARYVQESNLGYAALYSEIQCRLRKQDQDLLPDEISKAAAVISEYAWKDISRRRAAKRTRILPMIKEELWIREEPTPRCYLCGYQFTEFARNRYMESRQAGDEVNVQLPLVVDFTRPRGLNIRDLTVEIDHVAPVSFGGKNSISNLRLACGWCNRTKSNRASLYDVSATQADLIRIDGPGYIPVPQPFWILRVVATRGRCEYGGGCSATLKDHELFVAPRNLDTVLNPVNCVVYCSSHDPWATVRYVGRGYYS